MSLLTTFLCSLKNNVRIRRDDTDAISRLYACLNQGVRKVLDPLSPKSASLRHERAKNRRHFENSPDSKGITNWKLHVRMDEGDFVRVDLCRTKNESQRILFDTVQSVLHRQMVQVGWMIGSHTNAWWLGDVVTSRKL